MNNVNIYGILCKTTWKVYYGSTSKTIDERLRGHEYEYTEYLKKGIGKNTTSVEIIKNNNYIITLLETCDENDRNEREGFYIRNFQCVNRIIPDRSPKEYNKKWLENNKDYRKEYFKGYYENNRESILEYHKEYNEINKEKINEKKKEYYQINKEKISEKNKVKYTCQCGVELTKCHKSRHERTSKHQNYLKNLKNTLINNDKLL